METPEACAGGNDELGVHRVAWYGAPCEGYVRGKVSFDATTGRTVARSEILARQSYPQAAG